MNRPPRPFPPDLRAALGDAPPDVVRRTEQVWNLLGDVHEPVPSVPSDEAAWRELEAMLGRSGGGAGSTSRFGRGRADRPARSAGRRARQAVYGVASLLALVIGVAAWWWARPVAVVAPPSTRLAVTLPDGSTAELNSGTRLLYRRGFERLPFVAAAERQVRLDGEAFFHVEAGARPFVVETFNARVEVLGTTFNVRARQGRYERATHVAVASGRVRVATRGAAEADGAPELATVVEPGAAVHVTDTLRVEAASATTMERVLAWRADGFAAVERPLAAILAEVERRFDVDVTAQAGIDLGRTMTVVYQRDVTAEQILHDLCLAGGMRYHRTSRGFGLVPAARPAPPPTDRPVHTAP